MNDNLPELKDIHIPDGVSVFPLAYGWYVLLGAVLLFFFCLYFYLIWRQRSRKRYALKLISELDYTNIIVSAIKISELLRRICIYRYPDAVSLSGKKWIEFLCSHTKYKLSEQSAELLLNAPYIDISKHNFSQNCLDNLIKFTQSWIGDNL